MRALSALVVTLAGLAAAPLAAQTAAVAAPVSAATASDMARALRVLRAAPVLDGHNDLPWRIREDSVHPRDVEAYDLRARAPGMTDLPRLKQGHVGAQFWSVYIPGERGDATYAPNGTVSSVPGYARVQLEQIDIARRVVAKYPALRWTPTASAARLAMRDGAVASLLGMEGGHAIENSLEALRQYYDLGARYMTLTHNVTLDWADAALDSAAARAEIATWQRTHPRPAATVADVADHIDHVRKIAGVDHVGIGGDFDGITENVVGLEDVSTYPNLFAELVHRGWSDSDLAKLANGNALRVLARAEQVAARLQKTRGPSQATIERLDGVVKPTP